MLAMQENLPLFVAALLTWIAGFVDAVGFVSLGGIYTANMSGNSVAIGIRAAEQNWPEMVRRLWPVVIYVAGLLLCRILIEIGARERIRAIASLAFLGEIALLVPACLASSSHAAADSYLYIALLALAMGVQNAALTHFSSLTLHTGFVTGTLLKMSEEFTKFLTWAFDQIRMPGNSVTGVLARSSEQKAFRMAAGLAVIWTLYVVGACCGAVGHHSVQLKALIIPIAGLIALIVLDLLRPLAIRDEQEQAKVSS
jgi:uncharacterized membrane protein YoaK (UPF0700 family)